MNGHDRPAEVSRRQMISSLEELQRRQWVYEAALASTPDLVYVFDLNHRFIYANAALLRMWGRSWDEAIGKTCLELGYPDWHAAIHSREIDHVIQTRQPIKGEVPFHGANGRRIYEYILVPVVNEAGEVEAVSGTTRDVTDRKRDEEEIGRLNHDLQQRVAEFETLLAVMPIGIAVARDPQCHDIRVNPAFGKMLRVSPEQNASKTAPADQPRLPFRCFDASGREIPDDQLPMQVAARECRELRDLEFDIVHPDGSVVRLLEYAAPLLDEQGASRGSVGAFVDISALRAAEIEQLRLADERETLLASERSARAEAEHVSRMKDEFLATLSHELRTPLNAILGYATLLRMANVADLSPADLTEAIETIERNARLQAQLIEDLLDMNRIISGKIRLDVQEVKLVDVVDEAIASVRPSAEAKEITLLRIVHPEAGRVWGDPARLQQVVWNLLSNAIKFTPRGGHVHLSLERVDGQVEIAVSDTGKGISSDFLPHVFDRFSQADSSTTRRYGGLGLGLSIVRHLVELHGGTISASSPGEGLGTTFVVSLPLTAAAEVDAGEGGLPSNRVEGPRASVFETGLHGVRVLVVDDEPDAAKLAERLLEQCGAEVERAGSVGEAMELLKRHSFDVVVSDIGMPGEDGYQFIRRVRALDNPHRDVPVVALTAFARDEDRKKAVQAGFQSHLTKPVEAAELIAVVANLTRRAGLA